MIRFRSAVAAALLLLAGEAQAPAQTRGDVSFVETGANFGQSNDRRAQAPRNTRRANPPPGNAAPAPDYRPGAGRLDHQTGGPNPSIPSR